MWLKDRSVQSHQALQQPGLTPYGHTTHVSLYVSFTFCVYFKPSHLTQFTNIHMSLRVYIFVYLRHSSFKLDISQAD